MPRRLGRGLRHSASNDHLMLTKGDAHREYALGGGRKQDRCQPGRRRAWYLGIIHAQGLRPSQSPGLRCCRMCLSEARQPRLLVAHRKRVPRSRKALDASKNQVLIHEKPGSLLASQSGSFLASGDGRWPPSARKTVAPPHDGDPETASSSPRATSRIRPAKNLRESSPALTREQMAP